MLLLLVVKHTLSFRFDWKLIHFIDHKKWEFTKYYIGLPHFLQWLNSALTLKYSDLQSITRWILKQYFLDKVLLGSYFTYRSYKCYPPKFSIINFFTYYINKNTSHVFFYLSNFKKCPQVKYDRNFRVVCLYL